MMRNSAKNFLATSSSVLYNYFNNPIKLFSNLYLAKFFRYFVILSMYKNYVFYYVPFFSKNNMSIKAW